MRFLRLFSIAVVSLIVGGLLFLRLVHGSGSFYADLSTSPAVPEADVQTLVSLPFPPGNVSASPTGRVFFAYHPFAQLQRFGEPTVFELVDGVPRPYPSKAHQARYQGVFGMTVDRQNRLWMVEPASLDHPTTRLTAFDLTKDAVVFEHEFQPGEARFAQDLRVTPDGSAVILADTGLFRFTRPALIVLDLATRKHRTLLSEHPSTQAQDWITRTPFGPHKLGYGLVTFSVGLDGIEISRDAKWLYYAAMSHATLYRIPLDAVLDPRLSEADLASRIEPIGAKPLSDGITLDADGGVLITDVEHGGIARMDASGRLETLTRSAKVIWADGVVTAPDGSVLFTDSAIPAYIDQFARPPSAERLKSGGPYRILRFVAPKQASPR